MRAVKRQSEREIERERDRERGRKHARERSEKEVQYSQTRGRQRDRTITFANVIKPQETTLSGIFLLALFSLHPLVVITISER